MIEIGLTGWGDHPSLITDQSKKLENYAGHFPIVELDSSFYAIPSNRNILNWIEKTPENFQFVPKAFGGMTQHKDWLDLYNTMDEMFNTYIQTFSPMISKNKIKCFLFQFPPFFDCTKSNVQYLRKVRRLMKNLPIAIEFRNPTWFSEKYKEKTLQFLTDTRAINVIVDQAQTPNNSIPMVPVATHDQLVFYRLHGRNYEGWLGKNTDDWRKERTLYDYSEKELIELKSSIENLENKVKEVIVIFNNNSGHHAAPNAKAFQKLCNIEFKNLAPRQLDLDLF